jgi:L,D-transpeptidase ErfK/SrfK
MKIQKNLIINRVLSIIQNFLPKILILLAIGLLNACQILPGTFKFGEQPLENIETNRFFLNENDSVIGQIAAVQSQKGETLPDIARHFGLGFNEIIRANKDLNVWQLREQSRVLLPLQFILPDAPREGIVMNLANMRLFYYPDNANPAQSKAVMSFPVGIGKEGWDTPLGKTKIVRKTKAPSWHVPTSIRSEHALKGDPLPAVVQSGPDNPLGEYAMHLGFPSYLIHGTNKPYGVGLRISHGCVRLYPKGIEELFQQVSVGTQVKIVNQPYLIGWGGEMLYLEVHSSVKQQEKIRTRLSKLLADKRKQNSETVAMIIDWGKVEKILAEAAGIPIPILVTKQAYFNFDSDYGAPLVMRPDRLYGMPVVPKLLPDSWSVLATTFSRREHAIKLAAILNHQGPQIPSRVFGNSQDYQVIAGPFESQKQAQKVADRIHREFEIDAQVQNPGSKKIDEFY